MFARFRRAARRDDGASAVEFALVLPLLLLVIFGIVAFGLILFTQITAEHTAREAARAAAVGVFKTCADPGGSTTTDLTAFIQNDLGLTPQLVKMTPSSASPKPGDRVVISFSAPADQAANGALEGVVAIIPGASFLLPDTLPVKAESRIEVVGSVKSCG